MKQVQMPFYTLTVIIIGTLSLPVFESVSPFHSLATTVESDWLFLAIAMAPGLVPVFILCGLSCIGYSLFNRDWHSSGKGQG